MKNLGIKNIRGVFYMLALIATFVVGCKDDDDATPVDTLEQQRAEVLGQLAGETWSVSTVTVDNLEQNSLFENLSLSFGDGTFTSQNGGEVWPSSGTWQFANDGASAIIRDDGTVVNIVTLNASTLVLSLSWSGNSIGLGRSESISGEHVFTLIK